MVTQLLGFRKKLNKTSERQLKWAPVNGICEGYITEAVLAFSLRGWLVVYGLSFTGDKYPRVEFGSGLWSAGLVLCGGGWSGPCWERAPVGMGTQLRREEDGRDLPPPLIQTRTCHHHHHTHTQLHMHRYQNYLMGFIL